MTETASKRPRRLPSTRRRLVSSILAALLVVLAIAGTVAVIVVRDRLIARVDHDLESTAASIRAFATPEQLVALGQRPNPGANNQATMIIDASGATVLFIPSGTPTHPTPPPDLANFSVADLTARAGKPFSRPAVHGSSVTYRVLVSKFGDNGDVLVLAAPITDQQETIRQLATIQLVAAVAALAVIGSLVWLFSRVGIKPIEDMIGVASAIGGGDLGARVDTDPHSTEVARLASALNAMLQQLEVAFAGKDASEARLRRFAADASHELRTPLTTIQGWADLYASGGANTPEMLSKAMDRISHETQRMSALVEDLLLLARLDEQRPLDSIPVDLRAVVAESVEDLRRIQPRRPITVDLPVGPVVVHGDEARLRQVVANLLTNIRVHTDPEVPAQITLRIQGASAQLVIADEGAGLSEADATRAFDRFYRSEDSRARSSGGTGLGLAIVRTVVESHGGTITLASAPGMGVTFTISLPFDQADRNQTNAAPRHAGSS
jgi:two-component system, OmpR family, sensor kinase